MDAEVLVARPVADPVVLDKALALRLRDRRLTALDRVEPHQLGEAPVRGGPGVDALLGLGSGGCSHLAADGLDEAVPEGDVVLLLSRVAKQVDALGFRGGLGDRGAEAGDRSCRVAVLDGVIGQLLASQISSGPALVEGVLENVPAGPGLLDPLPDVVAHLSPS